MPAMRWDCKSQGCFNIKMRPKIERFDDCFPGRMAMGDVDGLIERRSRFLMLEWKSVPWIPRGQEIMYQRLSATCPFHIFIATGNAETMDVQFVQYFRKGELYGPFPCDIDKLHSVFKKWDTWACIT